jgi:Holliday junction resolvasome RuvABC endonuclease subunit
MRVLSLDPALSNFAFCLFENEKLIDAGLVKTLADSKPHMTCADKDRLRVVTIVRQIKEWINSYKPDLVVTEQPLSTAKSSLALKALSLISGVIYAYPEIDDTSPPWEYIRVHDIKQEMLGRRRSTTKLEIIEAVLKRHPELKRFIESKRSKTGFSITAEHMADAAAVFETYRHTPGYKMLKNLEHIAGAAKK